MNPKAFHFTGYEIEEIKAPYKWTPGQRGSNPDSRWPPEVFALISIYLMLICDRVKNWF